MLLALSAPMLSLAAQAASFNKAMQPTADRRNASLRFMKTRPLQFTLALASGG